MKIKVCVWIALATAVILGLAACTRSMTSPNTLPLPTATLELSLPGDNLPTEDPIQMLYAYATQTAAASGIISTPPAEATPEGGITSTPEEGVIESNPTVADSGELGTISTPTVSFVVPTATPGLPQTYTLQPREFPYCIARRFNVDPEELLALNNLTDGQLFQPGLVLKIPQSGKPFPSERALIPHPATYVVKANDTIYSIACAYGDVDPMMIVQLNGLTPPYTLTVGQTLNIP